MKPVMYVFAHSIKDFEKFKAVYANEDIEVKRVATAFDLRGITPGQRIIKLPFNHATGIKRNEKVERDIAHYCLHSRISVYNITGTKYERLLEEALGGSAAARNSLLNCADGGEG